MAAGLLLQGLLVGLWWWQLLSIRSSIDWFQPSILPDQSLLSFWLADSLLLVLGSVITAWAILSDRRVAIPGLWILVGGSTYGALYCLGSSLISDQAWLATTLMFAMAAFNVILATMFGSDGQPQLTRVSPKTRSAALAWTFFQAALFWFFFLVLLPLASLEVGERLEWSRDWFPGQQWLGVGLLIVFSVIGVWSGWTMAIAGHGTPLPTSAAPRLVIAGPYRWVRNPMAVAGIGQGLAVGLAIGSGLMIGICVVGAVLWHVLVRPWEETDLESRFDDAYRNYRQNVGLWCPRLTPYDRPQPKHD